MASFNSLVIQDPNWYKARNKDGLEGMIPYNYVSSMETEKNISTKPVASAGQVGMSKAAVPLRKMP